MRTFKTALMVKAVMLPLLFLAALSAPAVALNDNALWLPQAYQALAPELRQAALKLESDERCKKLLRGSLHDSTRSLDEAVFLLVCRDVNRRTFSVLADANTLQMEYPVEQIVAAEEEVKSSDEVLNQRVDILKVECEQLFVQKTRFMKNLRRIDESSLGAPQIDGARISFVIPFDAQSLQGNPLRYEAICASEEIDQQASFAIKARKASTHP